ncbi:MAG: hypothetical protein EA412_12045 [Chitinophagaceae bacterium]|nr:MAG: hypothetical protein EA412_12045 [Chitinophagaceae bacterium]
MTRNYLKLTILSIFLSFGYVTLQAQQTIQLFQENFNGATHQFELNVDDSLATQNFGPNTWIVNNEYDGAGIYPNTPDQSNVVSGTITGAPNSKYLHIHDSASSGTTANASYDSDEPSDRFVKMQGGFCTLGMDDVIFSFFYIAGGNADDYAEVYYSTDGGDTWTQTGNQKYNNQPLWRYTTIQDPAFNGEADLRFAFRWVNSGSSSSNEISFGVDDIIVVGTPSPSLEFNIQTLFPNPVCRGNPITVVYNITEPTCGGSFSFQISNATGSFATPTSLGVVNVAPGTTIGAVSLIIPTNAAIASCYRIRMVRLSPVPQIVGNASVCIETIDCGNSTTAQQPVIDMGPDTMCINSIISVPFFSTGAYEFDNFYIAELSDSNGSFNDPTFIGEIFDNETYDPSLGSDPGSVGGIVPEVPPGCGYYIRILATSPDTPDSLAFAYGPICIRECDILTNDIENVQLCINELYGDSAEITININEWNTDAVYLPGNEFQVQILDPEMFFIINTGVLGSVEATSDTTLIIYAPPLNDLLALGLAPGPYFMRIVATNSTSENDVLGTIVNLTIGAPSIEPPDIIPADSVLCAGDLISLQISPFNDESDYEWYSEVVNFGLPFFWEFNPLLINTANSTPGQFSFTVREHNYGCVEEWADSAFVDLIGVPNVNIQGQTPICIGDTVTFKVEFIETTFYQWSLSNGEIIDISNNEITVYFDAQGLVNLSVNAVNECGSVSGSNNFQVRPKPFMTVVEDTIICPGETVQLFSNSTGSQFYWFENEDTISNSAFVSVSPGETTVYTAQSLNQFGCAVEEEVEVEVYSIPSNLAGDDVAFCNGDSATLGSESIETLTYNWSPNTGLSNADQSETQVSLENNSSIDLEVSYLLSITDTNNCVYTDSVLVTVYPDAPAYAGEDEVITEGESVQLIALGGLSCIWEPALFLDNSEACEPISTPDSTITYYLTVVDENNCVGTDSMTIVVEEMEDIEFSIAVPNVFSPKSGGLNNAAGVIVEGDIQLEYFRIFNRWGEMVFETNDVSMKWDGTYKNSIQPSGNYVYILQASSPDGQNISKTGEILLLR